MTDIYVVISGNYSDQSVICAFEDENAADLYCKEMNSREKYESDEYRWERIDVNPPLPSVVEEIVREKTQHVAHVEEDKIADGRQFYRIVCTCSFRSGPLWSAKSAEEYKAKHERIDWW